MKSCQLEQHEVTALKYLSYVSTWLGGLVFRHEARIQIDGNFTCDFLAVAILCRMLSDFPN